MCGSSSAATTCIWSRTDDLSRFSRGKAEVAPTLSPSPRWWLVHEAEWARSPSADSTPVSAISGRSWSVLAVSPVEAARAAGYGELVDSGNQTVKESPDSWVIRGTSSPWSLRVNGSFGSSEEAVHYAKTLIL